MPTRALPPAFQVVLAPIQAFFRLEAAGGIVLAFNAAAAMIWANSPAGEIYRHLLELPVSLGLSSARASFTVHELVNDGLMAVFFLLVGLEIKRELVVGELSSFGQALLPAIAALGGMIAPSAIYLAFNFGGPGARGWAIPMATDIAFSIGVLTLLGKRVAAAMVVFLTALAIFDDLGGILVIAGFYGGGVHALPLGAAAALALGLYGLNRAGIRNVLPYAALGALLWVAFLYGGIHATIAGVALGMAIPARSGRPAREVLKELHAYAGELVSRPEEEDLENAEVVEIEHKLEQLEPPLNRLEHMLHPWVAFGVVPLFALANSGVSLHRLSFGDLLAPVPLGILLGLVLGKQLGIFACTAIAVRLGVAKVPGGASLRQVHGVAVVGGIGFTVALFVADLAFSHKPELLAQAKLGILVGSFVSAVLGYALLRIAPSRSTA